MRQLLFATVRGDDASGILFNSHQLQGQGELRYGLVEVDQDTDPDKALQRKSPFSCNDVQIRHLTNSQFRRQLHSGQDRRPILLDVHGLKTTFLKSLRRGFRLQQTFGRPVVVFSWPSGSTILHYDLALINLRTSVHGLSSLLVILQPQVACILAICHSMGARLTALAVRPHTLERGAQQHKFVFAAADMRQQDFCHELGAGGVSNLHRVLVLLASSKDKALKFASWIHTVPHTLLHRDRMDGSGSRAGSCETSLCCHHDTFDTLECSEARCADTENHEYFCSSPAVVACLNNLFDDVAWDTQPQIVIRPIVAETNNNRNKRTLQVKTLVGP